MTHLAYSGGVGVDLTVPAVAILATTAQILSLSSQEKLVLIHRMSLDELMCMSVEKLELLEPADIPCGKLGPFELPEYGEQLKAVESTLGRVAIMSTPPKLRWYTIVAGVNFTGVCRGTDNLSNVCPKNVSGVLPIRGRTQIEARARWIHAYCKGDVRIL